jgi:hypothetical protein
MKSVFAISSFAILATLAMPAASTAADPVSVYGSAQAVRMLAPYAGLIEAKGGVAITASTHGSGQLVLDVLDGKAVAAAIAMPLPLAIAAAREAAWDEGRVLNIPISLRFYPVAGLGLDDVPAGFVTIGTPPEALRKVLVDLR